MFAICYVPLIPVVHGLRACPHIVQIQLSDSKGIKQLQIRLHAPTSTELADHGCRMQSKFTKIAFEFVQVCAPSELTQHDMPV